MKGLVSQQISLKMPALILLENKKVASNRKQFKKRRKSLFEKQNGLCHYCKCKMLLIFAVPPGRKKPDNLCTIEHLRDRFDPTRQEPNYNREQRWVAACNKCNNERNRQ